MESISPLGMVIIFVVVSIGAAVQGSVGYGMGLLASPILILIEPKLIPGPFTAAAFLLIILMLIREKQALDFRGLSWLLPGLIIGLGGGALLLSSLPQATITTVFGILIILAVLMSLSGIRFQPKKPLLLATGLLSGFMGILTTISGPPLALVYQDAPGARIRTTLSAFFVVASIFAILFLIPVGRFGVDELRLSLYIVPGIILGFALSSRIVPWVDRGHTRPAVLTIAAVSAVIVIIKQLI